MDVLVQLKHIESLQARIRVVLQNDSLENLESMTAELGSRVTSVLHALHGEMKWPEQLSESLRQTLQRHAALITLLQRKLQVTSTEVAKARASRQAALQYAVAPALAESRCGPDTDLLG